MTTLQVPDETFDRLRVMAEMLHMPVTGLLDHISQPAFELTSEQLAEIDGGLADLAEGRVMSHEDMNDLFRRFEK